MKKTLILIAIMVFPTIIMAQKNPIDKIIEKYDGKEGFVTITLTGEMMKMAMDVQKSMSDTNYSSQLDQMKILVQKETDHPGGFNLYDELYDQLDKSVYKEMMKVKEADQDVTLLINESNGVVSEFILIVGGGEENVLVYASGNILLREVSDIAGNFDVMAFQQLKQLEH